MPPPLKMDEQAKNESRYLSQLQAQAQAQPRPTYQHPFSSLSDIQSALNSSESLMRAYSQSFSQSQNLSTHASDSQPRVTSHSTKSPPLQRQTSHATSSSSSPSPPHNITTSHSQNSPTSTSHFKMSGDTIIISLDPNITDAATDPPHQPNASNVANVIYRPTANPENSNWYHKLGQLAAKEFGHPEATKKGATFKIDRLPSGYVLWDKTQATSNRIDKYVFGHPSRKKFDSVVKLWPHIRWLSFQMQQGACPCVNCAGPRAPVGESLSSGDMARKQGKPKNLQVPSNLNTAGKRSLRYRVAKDDQLDSEPTQSSDLGKQPHKGKVGRPARSALKELEDSDGNPLVFKNYIIQLKEKGTMMVPWIEQMNMDWRAGVELRHEIAYEYKCIPSFVPRVGEMVLFTYDMPGNHGMGFTEDNKYVCYDSRGVLHKELRPYWRAGVVTQLNDREKEPVGVEDMTREPAGKKWAINFSGFRVETFPDSNSDDKSYSKQYKYVPLHHIRPLNYWQDILDVSKRLEWHPSIEHAMTMFASYNLVDRVKFKGTWPIVASAVCGGMFLGSEQLRAGDAIRLFPDGSLVERAEIPKEASSNAGKDNGKGKGPAVASKKIIVTDILVAEDFRIEWIRPNGDPTDPALGESCRVVAVGRRFTIDPNRAHPTATTPLSSHARATHFRFPNMEHYGNWYAMDDPKQKSVVPFHHMIGRLYEPLAQTVWWQSRALGLDANSVREGRRYGRLSDNRIGLDEAWFWGNCRTECLDVMEVNGELTSGWDKHHNPKMWRANLRIIDGNGNPTPQEIMEARPYIDMARKVPDMQAEGKMVSMALGDDKKGKGGKHEDADVDSGVVTEAETSKTGDSKQPIVIIDDADKEDQRKHGDVVMGSFDSEAEDESESESESEAMDVKAVLGRFF